MDMIFSYLINKCSVFGISTSVMGIIESVYFEFLPEQRRFDRGAQCGCGSLTLDDGCDLSKVTKTNEWNSSKWAWGSFDLLTDAVCTFNNCNISTRQFFPYNGRRIVNQFCAIGAWVYSRVEVSIILVMKIRMCTDM